MSRARKVEIVAVALAAVCLGWFILSTRFVCVFSLGRCIAGFAVGCGMLDCRPAPVIPMANCVMASSFEVELGGKASANGPFVLFPLWAPVVLLVTIAALAHRRARKPKPGTCWKCGYDLTGNISGICSECGTRA